MNKRIRVLSIATLVAILVFGAAPRNQVFAGDQSKSADETTTIASPSPVLEDARAKAEVDEISKAIGKTYYFSETKNFVWCTSVPPSKAAKIAEAAERAFATITKILGEENYKKYWTEGRKAMGVVCANKRDFKKFVKWYGNKYPVWNKDAFISSHSTVDWFPVSGTRNCFVTHFKPHDEKFVRAIAAHEVGHLVADRFKFHRNFVPAWLSESLGIYLEGKVIGKTQCGCYDDPYGLGEGDEDRQTGLTLPKFKARVKKSVNKKRLKTVKAILKLQSLNSLTFEDMQKGHLMISYMVSKQGKFAKFLTAMKKHWPGEIHQNDSPEKMAAQTKAIQEAYGLSLTEFDKELKKFASKGY